MALELNKVMLIGNLTRDPECRQTPAGTALAKLGLAVNRRYKRNDGETQEETAFVDIEAWSKTADFCRDYLAKGKRIYVEGRLKFDQWEASDGSRRSKLCVTADRIQFADSKPKADSAPYDLPPRREDIPAPAPLQPPTQPAPAPAPESGADDLPF